MRLIPPDPRLSALPELLPSTGLPDFVAEVVGEGMGLYVTPDQAELAFIRYRPEQDCTVLWSFPTSSGQRGLVSGRLFGNDHGASIITRASYQRLVEMVSSLGSHLACPYTYLPDYRLLLQAETMSPIRRWLKSAVLHLKVPRPIKVKVDIDPQSFL